MILPHLRRSANEGKDSQRCLPPSCDAHGVVWHHPRTQTHLCFQSPWLLPTPSSRFAPLLLELALPTWAEVLISSAAQPQASRMGFYSILTPSTGSGSRQCSVQFYRIEEGTLRRHCGGLSLIPLKTVISPFFYRSGVY